MSRGRLRVHFTAEDLGRVRIAPAVDFMWEITLSLHLLRTRESALVFDHWRRRVRDAISRAGAESRLAMLLAIDPPASYFPDFLTPAGYEGGLTGGIEAIRSTPARQLGEQLALLGRAGALPPSVRSLASGDRDAVGALCDTLRTYHDLALGPFRRRIEHRISLVREQHRERVAAGGSELLLRSLGSLFRWRPPVLEVQFPCDFDLHLDGRGLHLVPSFFCVGAPVKYFDDALPPTLVYPITHDPRWAVPANDRAGDSLALLIGESRARILEHIAGTGAASAHTLATRLHISAPTVSYHTKVLRDAGLITSRRDGPSVVHHLTSLGSALLDGVTAPAGPA